MKKNNIYNKVKSVALVVSLAAVGLSVPTSCGKWLETEPHNEITQENFWNQKSDVENIIAGCYIGIESNAVLSRMLVWGEFRSDNVTYNGELTAEKDANLDHILKENITASNGYTYWGDFYSVINRCNTVLYYAPQVAAKDPSYSDGELKAHLAEVTALRSLMYFYLIRTFENVPYSDEAYIDDNQEQKLAQTPFNEVLDKLIASLESVKGDAYTEFPESSNANEQKYSTGRVTKKFIYAMLCEMYLWKKDYDNCIKYADLIIDFMKQKATENKYTATDFRNVDGYPLINFTIHDNRSRVFGNVFNDIFVTGNSMEAIFELNINGDSYKLYNEPISNYFGAEGRTQIVKPSTYLAQLVDGKESTKVFAEKNNGYDGRLFESVCYSVSGDPLYVNKYTSAKGVTFFSSSSTPYKIGTYGLRYGVYGTNQDSRNNSNFIVYRLTDVMLLKAEALALKIQSENTISETTDPEDYALLQQAFNLVNVVNMRALYQETPSAKLAIADYPNKTQLLNLIYAERQREFLFEGKRYYDLVRRSMREQSSAYLADQCSNRSESSGAYIKSVLENYKAIFWPVNLDEIKANDKLQQNPAFGSGENSSFQNSSN